MSIQIDYTPRKHDPNLRTVHEIADSLSVELNDMIAVFMEHGMFVSIYQQLDKETEEFIVEYYKEKRK